MDPFKQRYTQLLRSFTEQLKNHIKGKVLSLKGLKRRTTEQEFVLSALNKIVEVFKDKTEIVQKAFDSHRFDCKQLGLNHTVIVGEEGGLFMLINAIGPEEEKLLADFQEDNYLNSKKQQGKNQQGLEKITIGAGTFGKVKFCLTLISPTSKKISTGTILEVKKSFQISTQNPVQKVQQGLEEDYFAGELADFIQGPEVYDRILITNIVNGEKHCK